MEQRGAHLRSAEARVEKSCRASRSGQCRHQCVFQPELEGFSASSANARSSVPAEEEAVPPASLRGTPGQVDGFIRPTSGLMQNASQRYTSLTCYSI